MLKFRYLKNVSTIRHFPEKCVGCRMCEKVCPHQVFRVEERKAEIVDRDGCIECGACVINCRSEAIAVNPGVGCAAYILSAWLKGKENATCGDGCC